MAPQVVVDVDHQMSLMREESFGPVVGIMPVDDDEEAVRLMNDSAYGLTAAIFSADADVVAALGREIDTGTVFMNRCDYLDPALAWTGVKDYRPRRNPLSPGLRDADAAEVVSSQDAIVTTLSCQRRRAGLEIGPGAIIDPLFRHCRAYPGRDVKAIEHPQGP